MSKHGGLEARYRKLAHMAVALTNMMQELQHDISMQLQAKHESKSAVEDDGVLKEMQDTLVDGVMGLAGLVRVDQREPFSA